MQTLDAFFMEMSRNETLKKEFEEAASRGRLDDFMDNHGISASQEDVAAYVKQKQEEAGAAGTGPAELSEEEMENVTGGNNLRVELGIAFWKEVNTLIGRLPFFK